MTAHGARLETSALVEASDVDMGRTGGVEERRMQLWTLSSDEVCRRVVAGMTPNPWEQGFMDNEASNTSSGIWNPSAQYSLS